MGKDLYDSIPLVRSLFEEADEILRRNIHSIMFNGPDETLRQTENTQPALFIVSCALFELIKKNGILPSVAAGHSLGEYSALYAAGAFSFEQALRLVEQRGKLIQECCRENPGTMSAIIGLTRTQIEDICADCSRTGTVEAVNVNCPGQIVIAGSEDSVTCAEKRAVELGAHKIIRLNVSGPFHSSYMHKASVRMKEYLEKASINDIAIPVISNVDAKKTDKKNDIIAKLAAQIDHTVLWEDSIRMMMSMNIDTFIEVGPGKVLTGLNKRIDKKLNTMHVENIQTLEHVQKIIFQEC